MVIQRGNIKLVRLEEQHIELVRNWRNDPDIRKTMEYREYITPEMQLEWFNRVNNINNSYFLIETSDKFIGLVSATDIDWENNVTNNGGIFIWDKDYIESAEVLNASLLLTDIGFYMGMQRNYIRILKDNQKSIQYNRSIGYQLLPHQEEVYNQKYVLNAATYFKATGRIRNHFGFSDDIKLIGTQDEYNAFLELARKIEQAGEKYDKIISVEIVII